MATKAFKQVKIEEIKESFSKAKVAIVSDFRGLSVEEITDLRRRLQKENGELTVVKNTLTKFAIKGTPFEGLGEFLKGPSAIAFGFEDEVAPAKVITKFIKDTKKTEVKGGVLDGNVLSVADVKKLSTIPSKQELYAKMLGCINSPASGLVNTVNGVAKALVVAMDGVRQQKESQN